MWKNALLLMLILAPFPRIEAEPATYSVIPLAHRPAEEMLPLLLPLLDPDERVVANGSQLIVRAASDRLEAIRALVSQLDRGLQNLEISVIQATGLNAEELNARARLEVHVPFDHPAGTSARFQGRYNASDRHESLEQIHRVRTLEGRAAMIQVGRTLPYRFSTAYGLPYGLSETRLIDATSGFSVVPRLAGNQRVVLNVSPWSDRPLEPDGALATQGAYATVEAALGEWVEIGAVEESGHVDAHGTLARRYGDQRLQLKIFVKVEKVMP